MNLGSGAWWSDAVFGNGLPHGIGGERHIVFVGILEINDTMLQNPDHSRYSAL